MDGIAILLASPWRTRCSRCRSTGSRSAHRWSSWSPGRARPQSCRRARPVAGQSRRPHLHGADPRGLLFADATTVPLRYVEGDAGVPGRLLGIGLPSPSPRVPCSRSRSSRSSGAGARHRIGLAPTDAALGMAVTDRAVPVRIRRALNIESGLNDGIATPFVTVFLAALLSEEGFAGDPDPRGRDRARPRDPGRRRGRRARRPSLSMASRRGWTSHVSEQLCVLALASSPTWGRWRSAGTDS